MGATIIISEDQDVALCIRGPFPVREEMRDEETSGFLQATGAYRGLFWLRAEEDSGLSLELGYSDVLGSPQLAYLFPESEAMSAVLDEIVTAEEEAPESLLAQRVSQLLDFWENAVAEERVPVGRVLLWSRIESL